MKTHALTLKTSVRAGLDFSNVLQGLLDRRAKAAAIASSLLAKETSTGNGVAGNIK